MASLLVALMYWSLVLLPDNMVPGSPTPATGSLDRFHAVNAARTTVAQIIGGIVVILAGASTAWLTIRRVNALEKQVTLQVQGQVTDRLSRGIEQLGATSDAGPVPEIRAGAVFTLERVAIESPEDFGPVFQIVMGYLRTHSPRPADEGEEPVTRAGLRMDVAAAFLAFERLILRRPEDRSDMRVVLTRTLYPQANLSGADLTGADLGGADLGGANLRRAYLGGADLGGADLRRASLGEADLHGADLGGADLRRANLGGANLRGADLRMANLGRANLGGANLGGANLGAANVRAANLRAADLGGADLRWADLRGANLREADLREADLRRANLGGAYLREADLREADLGGAYHEVVAYDEQTVWPVDFRPPLRPNKWDEEPLEGGE
ncbi:MAG: pentapeptide repeat-containing protein [Dehalococcoidia bacterium]